MFPWGPEYDFLVGAGIGFLEEELVSCPVCGGDIPVDLLTALRERGLPGEEESMGVEVYRCPYCRETFEL